MIEPSRRTIEAVSKPDRRLTPLTALLALAFAGGSCRCGATVANLPGHGSDGGAGGLDGGGSSGAGGADGGLDGGHGVSGGGGLDGGCGLRSCATAHANCGPIGDGCGGVLQCGSCTAPETCGGGGVPSVCGGHAGCLPRSCAEAKATCGPVADGCGGLLQCGSCQPPESCGGAGVSNVCGKGGEADGGHLLPDGGCRPLTCADVGAACGVAGDGCGGLLQCGQCNAPDVCGGANIPYVCGDGSGAGGGGCIAPTVSCNTDAGAICTDVQSDSANCGGCGKACPASFTCANGSCSPQCTGAASCNADAGEICVGDHCANACDVALIGTSSVGCEFWPVHLWNTEDGTGYFQGPLGVVASNTSPTATANVTLEDATGVIQTQAVAPGSAALFTVPNARNRLAQTQQGEAFHLRSDVPIAAYEYNPVNAAQAFTGSADLLLPTHSLAQYYFVVSYSYNAGIGTSPPQGQGYLAVVGTQPNTSVQITVPVATSAAANGSIPAIAAGGTLSLTLGQGEAVEIAEAASLADITGATITSDKPVVAFGGSGATTVPDTAPGGDHFEAQLFPTAAWGTSYECEKYTVRSQNDEDHWKIVAGQSGTVVTLSDPTIAAIPTLSAGQVVEFSTAKSFDLIASKPVLVAHYLEAWGALSGQYDPATFPRPTTNVCPFAGGANDSQCIGDANMTLAIPTAQYLSSYTFYTPSSYAYDYVDVIAPMGSSITLDGSPIPALSAIGGGTYGLAQIPVQPGVHSMGGDQPFGITLYGYDYAISYTCVGGLNLRTIGFTGNPGSCTPLGCAAQGIQCGPAGDGCGGLVDGGCGTCGFEGGGSATCGGGGVPGVCGSAARCTPLSCAAQKLSCGPAGDGCGNVIQCGGCDAGSCGGGGNPGVCGSPGCTPLTCAGLRYDCGPAGDGCGGLLDCGTCDAGSCGGAGQPNVCGSMSFQ